ncbi:MAG: Lrp/AsnC family transcriptional regulator [Proteobacteria bacterium]|nr:Lrp/AsnC family transcriptional regulator [Pseudomonadota bacterium]NOG61755.1 Lrp/AsnC family transcriptional regulator [Pseudomonadota bacterium]
MNQIDRNIINHMQNDFPVCESPFAKMAAQLDMDEEVLINRIQSLLDDGTLSRFGPMYNIEKLGGQYSLVAMSVPEHDLESVIEVVNSYPEVAHNYERDHSFNVWFVIAAETVTELKDILKKIEKRTGYATYDMPKLEEFYIGLKFDA